MNPVHERVPSQMRQRALAILVLYVGCLLALGMLRYWPQMPDVSLWEMQDTSYLLEWIRATIVAGLSSCALCLPIGALTAYLVGSSTAESRSGIGEPAETSGVSQGTRRWVSGGWTMLMRVVLASCIATVVMSLVLESESSAPAMDFLPALIGCIMGVWVGSLWRWGRPGRMALAYQLLVVIALLIAGGAYITSQAVAGMPLPFEPPEVTSAAKRQIIHKLKRSRRATPDRTQVVLEEADANFLLAWGLSLGSPERKARVKFGEENSLLLASVGIGKTRYVNLQIAGDIEADSGRISMRIDRCVVGDLSVPRVLVESLLQWGLFVIERDEDLREAIRRVERIDVGANRLEVVGYEHDDESEEGTSSGGGLVSSLLAKLGDKPDVAAAVRIYIHHLLEAANTMPTDSDQRFEAFVSTAFQLAHERSRKGEADLENRAAILALGIVLGHPRLEELVGEVTDDASRLEMRRRVGNVTIAGRSDWTKHFTVSAALALLSSDFLSDAAGLLKEELDAERGSGFSFADLAADRAGTLFAIAATRDRPSARRMQKQLRGEFSIDDLFPEAHDLPEGLSDAELQAQYGGVGGQRYRELVQNIERRLEDCRLLQETDVKAHGS